MSKNGAIARGKIFYSFRNVDGKYPDVISKDSHKMEELNLFLKTLTKAKSPEVKNG